MKPKFLKDIVVEVRFPSDNGSDWKKDSNRPSEGISKRVSLDPTVQTLDTSSCTDLFSVSESETTNGVVRFDLDDTVFIPIPAIDDMPDDERRAIWFTRENYDVIMGANNIAVKLMRIGRENPEAFGHCFRGLEYRLSEHRKDREERTRNAFQAVFEEQKRQTETGEVDPKHLAKMYRLATLSSLEIAMLRGESDAQSAASYQLEHASSTPPPSSQRRTSTSSMKAATPRVRAASSSTAKPVKSSAIPEDDIVSVLSDESEDVTCSSEGHGLVNRLRCLVQKQRNSSGSSRSSSTRGQARRQC